MTVRTTLAAAAFCALLLDAAHARAGTPACSLHPGKGATKAELEALAKVPEAEARKTALASLKDPSHATVRASELEAEHGCLVYSYDVQIAGLRGVQEIQVDAGDGKVLSSKPESPRAEAAEKAKDKTGP
ncbi:MAG TPA: hypothetical protein VGG65_09285 [Thermoanaerobaculia bacterium]|jgi:hypothetical protein